MNSYHFDGRVARAIALTGTGDRAVARFTLIRNDYAGKDENTGESRERAVAIQFTAFRGKAEAIAKNFMKGDQMIVTAHVVNNDYSDEEGEHYKLDFIVDDFSFGAPGEAKREELAKRHRETARA